MIKLEEANVGLLVRVIEQFQNGDLKGSIGELQEEITNAGYAHPTWRVWWPMRNTTTAWYLNNLEKINKE